MKFVSTLTVVLITLFIQSCDSNTQIIPQSFVGTWDASESTCTNDVSLERLIITAKTIQYWESLGAVISVSKVSDTEIDIIFSIKDEAEDRLENQRYQLDSARNKLTEKFADGSSFVRVRCE